MLMARFSRRVKPLLRARLPNIKKGVAQNIKAEICTSRGQGPKGKRWRNFIYKPCQDNAKRKSGHKLIM